MLISRIIPSLPTELIERSVLYIYCDSWVVKKTNLSLDSTAPCGRPVAPVKIPSFSHSASLSLLHLCLTLSKTQHQNTFSLNAGATKEVTSPAAHRGTWHGAGATKSLLHSGTLKKPFALVKRCLQATTIFM